MNTLCRRLQGPDRRTVAACFLVACAAVVPRAHAADGPAAEEALGGSERAEVPLRQTLPTAGRSAPRTTASLEVDSQRQVMPAATEDQMRMRYVRWADTRGDAAVGLSVGVGLKRLTAGLPLEAQRENSRMAPEVGLRMRTGWRDDRRVDVDAWRSYDHDRAADGTESRPSNHARVELQFRQAKGSALDVPRGAFGLQTSANSQWVLRAKRGGPMVYYRARW